MHKLISDHEDLKVGKIYNIKYKGKRSNFIFADKNMFITHMKDVPNGHLYIYMYFMCSPHFPQELTAHQLFENYNVWEIQDG